VKCTEGGSKLPHSKKAPENSFMAVFQGFIVFNPI